MKKLINHILINLIRSLLYLFYKKNPELMGYIVPKNDILFKVDLAHTKGEKNKQVFVKYINPNKTEVEVIK